MITVIDNEGWFLCYSLLFDIGEALRIIDDSLSYGFEFKVEDHKIYARETE